MQPLKQSSQARPTIPDLHASMPDPGERHTQTHMLAALYRLPLIFNTLPLGQMSHCLCASWPGMGGWRNQGLQSGAERLSQSSAMLEPLPVHFAPQPGSAAAPLRPLHQGRDGLGPGAGTQGLSLRAGSGERDGSAALQQGPSHSPRFDTRPSPHGGILSEVSISCAAPYILGVFMALGTYCACFALHPQHMAATLCVIAPSVKI
jgi:hypothetical protein